MDSIKRPSTAQRRAAGTVSLNRESPSSSIHGSHASPFSQRDLVSQFAMGGDNGARPTSQSTDSRNITRSLDFNQNNNTINGAISNHNTVKNTVKLDGVDDPELAACIVETMRILKPLLFEDTPQLVPKLLAKPPFRYIHDIASSVTKGNSKFGVGLLKTTPHLKDPKAINTRELKIEYIRLLMSLVGAFHGRPIDLKPGKLVAGAEPIKTNKLLQDLALAASRCTSLTSNEAVEKAIASMASEKGERKKTPPPSSSSDRTNGNGKNKRRPKEQGADSVQKEVANNVKFGESPLILPKDKKSRGGGVRGDDSDDDDDNNDGSKKKLFENNKMDEDMKKLNINGKRESEKSLEKPNSLFNFNSSSSNDTNSFFPNLVSNKSLNLTPKTENSNPNPVQTVTLDPYEARAEERLRAVSAKPRRRGSNSEKLSGLENAPVPILSPGGVPISTPLSTAPLASQPPSIVTTESKPLAASESMYDFGHTETSPEVSQVKAVVNAFSPNSNKSTSPSHSTPKNVGSMERKWSFNNPTPPSGPKPSKDGKSLKARKAPSSEVAPGKDSSKNSDRNKHKHRRRKHRSHNKDSSSLAGDGDDLLDSDDDSIAGNSVVSSRSKNKKSSNHHHRSESKHSEKNRERRKRWKDDKESEMDDGAGITFSDLLDDSDDSDLEQENRRRKWNLNAEAKDSQSKAFEDAQKKAEIAARAREAARMEVDGHQPSSPPMSPRDDPEDDDDNITIPARTSSLARIKEEEEKEVRILKEAKRKEKEIEDQRKAKEIEEASKRALKAMENADADMALKKMKKEVAEEQKKQDKLKQEKEFEIEQKKQRELEELERIEKKKKEEEEEAAKAREVDKIVEPPLEVQDSPDENSSKKKGGFFSSLKNRFGTKTKGNEPSQSSPPSSTSSGVVDKENENKNNSSKILKSMRSSSIDDFLDGDDEDDEDGVDNDIEMGGENNNNDDDGGDDWGDEFASTLDNNSSSPHHIRSVEVMTAAERERIKAEEEIARAEVKAAELLQRAAEKAALKAADEALIEREKGRIATEKAEKEAYELRYKLQQIEEEKQLEEMKLKEKIGLNKKKQEEVDLELSLQRQERQKQAEIEINDLKLKAEKEAEEREKIIKERELKAAAYQEECEKELNKAKNIAELRVKELEMLLEGEKKRVEDERQQDLIKRQAEEDSILRQRQELEKMLKQAENQRLEDMKKFEEEKLAFEKQRAEMQAERLAESEELTRQRLQFEKEQAAAASELARKAAENKDFASYSQNSAQADAGGVPVEPFSQPAEPVDEPTMQEEEEQPVEPQYEVEDPYEQLDEGDKAYADAIAIAERKAEEARWEREAAERERLRERDRMLGFHAGRHCQSLSQLLETGFTTGGEETDGEALGNAFKDDDEDKKKPEENEGRGDVMSDGDEEDAPTFSNPAIVREHTDHIENENVNNDKKENSNNDDVDSKQSTTDNNEATEIVVGCRVELVKLKAKPELNGHIGEVQAYVENSGRFSVTIDGGKGTFDIKPRNLMRTMKPLPSTMHMKEESIEKSELSAKKAIDGLCQHCRNTQRQWNKTIHSRRDVLSAMSVMELRRLAGDTETDTVGCTGKADVVNRVLKKSRLPRTSPAQSDAFRNAFKEYGGTEQGRLLAEGGGNGMHHDEDDNSNALPGLHSACAAGHVYCARTFLRIAGGGGLYKGVKVKLVNLKVKPELNGSLGEVQAWVPSSNRFSIVMDNEKGTFDLKSNNLQRIIPDKDKGDSSDSEDILEDSNEGWLGAMEVDICGRTALYHATLENRIEIVKDLIHACPDAASVADENGDTSIHSSAAFSSQSLALVLKYLKDKSKIDLMNRNGMRPSHLAHNLQAFQELNARGCDLRAPDSRGRTSLFIACAMGRSDCSHFLVDLLSFDDDYLRQADERGDTPLHAAACNGSIKCTRLLLEYGVEPDVSNAIGLRPIDLAARRGHIDCERLLGEYHMHHGVEEANFDSVLFLNTLDGLRTAKNALDGADAPYEILRKAKQHSLSSSKSAWSLRRKKSMRVQQWGGWIAYEDAELQQVFWYNPKLGTHQWSPPQEVLDLQQKSMPAESLNNNSLPSHHVGADQSGKFGSAQWKALHMGSMRLKKMGSWIQYSGPGGRPFYYNEDSGFFQWDRPQGVSSFASMSSMQSAGGVGGARGGGYNGNVGPADTRDDDDDDDYGNEATEEEAWAYTDADAIGEVVPDDAGGERAANLWNNAVNDVVDGAMNSSPWEQYEDEEGNWYWYNHDTGASQWDTPEGESEYNEEGYDDQGGGEGYDDQGYDGEENYEGYICEG